MTADANRSFLGVCNGYAARVRCWTGVLGLYKKSGDINYFFTVLKRPFKNQRGDSFRQASLDDAQI